jgi:hypothetical protein
VDDLERLRGLCDKLIIARSDELSGVACIHGWDSAICPMRGCWPDPEELIGELLNALPGLLDRITALQARVDELSVIRLEDALTLVTAHETTARWKAMAEELAGSLIVALETAGDFTQVDQEACAAARQSLSRFNEMKGKKDD